MTAVEAPADDDEWDDGWEDEEPAEDETPELAYASVDAWVTGHLAPLIRRRVNGSVATWCPTWWRHPEAVSRLSALWRAWEHLRQDPATGLSDWWVHHADPHLSVLFDPDTGPFAACHPLEGHSERPLEPLPVIASPPQMWLSPALSDQDARTASDGPVAPVVGGTVRAQAMPYE